MLVGSAKTDNYTTSRALSSESSNVAEAVLVDPFITIQNAKWILVNKKLLR